MQQIVPVYNCSVSSGTTTIVLEASEDGGLMMYNCMRIQLYPDMHMLCTLVPGYPGTPGTGYQVPGTLAKFGKFGYDFEKRTQNSKFGCIIPNLDVYRMQNSEAISQLVQRNYGAKL